MELIICFNDENKDNKMIYMEKNKHMQPHIRVRFGLTKIRDLPPDSNFTVIDDS